MEQIVLDEKCPDLTGILEPPDNESGGVLLGMHHALLGFFDRQVRIGADEPDEAPEHQRLVDVFIS
jgi:hypothetical protein